MAFPTLTAFVSGAILYATQLNALRQASIYLKGKETNQANVEIEAPLHIKDGSSYFRPPRATTAQRTAISSPPDGAVVYDTTEDELYLRADGAWVPLAQAAHESDEFANVNPLPGLYSIGTLDHNLYRINPQTGNAVDTGAFVGLDDSTATGAGIRSICWADGVLYIVKDDATDNKLYTLNIMTRSISEVGTLGSLTNVTALTWNGSNLYAYEQASTNGGWYRVNTDDATVAKVGGQTTNIQGACWDPIGQKVYAVQNNNTLLSDTTFDSSMTSEGSISGMDGNARALAYVPETDSLRVITSSNKLYSVSKNAGAATLVADGMLANEGLTYI